MEVATVRFRPKRSEMVLTSRRPAASARATSDALAVAADDLRVGAGRPGERAALADLRLDVVHDRPDRDRGERQGVARLDVRLRPRGDRVARREALRREDVGVAAVLVADQRDVGRAVGIVLDPLHAGRVAEPPAPLEVDDAVGPLVAAAAEAHGDPAGVVAPALLRQAFRQRLDRLALVEALAVDDHELPEAGRDGLEMLQSHGDDPFLTGPW